MSPWAHVNTFAFTYTLVWKYFGSVLSNEGQFLKDSLMPDMVLKRKRELLWTELVGQASQLCWDQARPWSGGQEERAP